MQKTSTLIEIDGSQGEGGGQILRTALTLSMITGKAFQLNHIRAKRKKAGLMRQHLVCVQAARRISHAEVKGDALNSQTLYFAPQQVCAGQYEFNIGSAGSTTLVLQTLLPALLLQDQPSTLCISGGTHNPLAPSTDFIEHCFLPTLQKIGISVDFHLKQAGFFPIGAGKFSVTIYPWKTPVVLSLLTRGHLKHIHAYAFVLNLEQTIAQRELKTLDQYLNLKNTQCLHREGISQGNSLFVTIDYEHHQQTFTALGEVKKSAESIAEQLAKEVQAYLDVHAVADEYLTDQLLLPLALGKGGQFTATVISEHTRTQAKMIQQFLDCQIDFIQQDQGHWLVTVQPD